MDIVDFTPCMSPARHFLYHPGFSFCSIQFIEPSIGIGLKHTTEASELALRVNPLSIL